MTDRATLASVPDRDCRPSPHTSPPHTERPASRRVMDTARSVTALDPTLLPEFAAVAIVVDAHAAALEVTLRRFNTLEGRLGRVMRGLQQRGCGPNEDDFAALLDYIGSSDVRVRIEDLVEVFPP